MGSALRASRHERVRLCASRSLVLCGECGVRLIHALSGVDHRIGQLGDYELYAEPRPELRTEAVLRQNPVRRTRG